MVACSVVRIVPLTVITVVGLFETVMVTMISLSSPLIHDREVAPDQFFGLRIVFVFFWWVKNSLAGFKAAFPYTFFAIPSPAGISLFINMGIGIAAVSRPTLSNRFFFGSTKNSVERILTDTPIDPQHIHNGVAQVMSPQEKEGST